VDGIRTHFRDEEIERARRYHRPRYYAVLLDTALGLGVLGALAFTAAGDQLYGLVDGVPWWARALAVPSLVLACSTLVRLPVSLWSGFLHERRWGFSTQSPFGWLADRAKSFAVGAVFTSAALALLVVLAHALPGAWPAAAAAAFAALVLVVSFVAPVLLEPVFNRFAPLPDQALADDLRALGARAGVPVRDVLVADASRRTRKENAYVSGLGGTRRVVLFDTLLSRAPIQELRLIVAHELGHRRLRHVAKWTGLGMAGSAAAVLVVWALVPDVSDPRNLPAVMLVFTVLELAASPFNAWLSRRWERDADRFSLGLTHDPDGYVTAHRGLAVRNLADLDPPRAAYLFLFTHPTPSERIAAAGSTRADLASAEPLRRLRQPLRPEP